MGKEYVDGSGAPVDYSRDQFQGCNHYGFSGTTSPVNGFPRTTEPRKTWLDECAMMEMQAIISKHKARTIISDKDDTEYSESVAIGAYEYAEAMLAEKIKREAKE